MPSRRPAPTVGDLFIDPAELRELYLDLKASSPVLALELRRAIKGAGEYVAQTVRANAAQASTDTGRIPAAVKTGATFAKKTAGLRVYVLQSKAPEARPLESLGNKVYFRHPVWGNREVWVNQQTRPFFFKSLNARTILHAEGAVLIALDKAARAAGFHYEG